MDGNIGNLLTGSISSIIIVIINIKIKTQISTVLKKPSELFEKKEEKLVDQLLEESQTSSKAVKSFRDSVQKINSLSDFSETLDNYQKSVDDVSNLSKEVETLREDIKDLLTSEDLDRAMMGQIVLIDKTISDLQENVKSINEKKLKEIRGSVSSLTDSVNEFLEVDAPKYKRLLIDHEKRSSKRYEEFEETVDTAFKDVVEEVDTTISKIYDEITSTVDGINQESFKSLLEDVRDLGKKQEDKYKQIIVDTEVRVDERYASFEESVNTKFEEKYNTLQESVDTRCEDLTSLLGQLTDKVALVEGNNSDVVKSLNEKVGEALSIKRNFSDLKKTFTEQQSDLEKYKEQISEEVTSLKVDVLRNETHIKNQVSYDEEIDDLRKIVDGEVSSNVDFKEEIKSYTKGLDDELNQVVERVADQQTYNEYYKRQQDDLLETYKQEFNTQKDLFETQKEEVGKNVDDLREEIVRNEEVVRDAIKKLDLNKVEKQNYELSNKIKRLEELFDSFSEKVILSESIIAEPPSTNNDDPLTPLDQKFVTFDQLNNHYRTFINRIQTQLATLGGGGETRLEFLDDVDRDTAKVDGKFLKYDESSGKFVGADGGSGGGSGITTANVRDAIQGYYGYTTDYYTVGVANTTQFVGAGETTMIMPQVAAVYQYMPTVMSGVSTNPYVGTGATIGTGQTEFSLAGLSSGASCIVRTALAFDPDEDNTTLDVQLKFTTNTATQGTGLTNFTVLKENALIMQVGGEQQYISENLFSFFVGTTLEGTTQSDAGSFRIEVNPSSDGDLEVLAVTVNVVA